MQALGHGDLCGGPKENKENMQGNLDFIACMAVVLLIHYGTK